ncbi:hypothetical protein NDA06_25985 [Trichocoleus sp. ST-U1]
MVLFPRLPKEQPGVGGDVSGHTAPQGTILSPINVLPTPWMSRVWK